MLLGSMSIKAACKMLVKLTPEQRWAFQKLKDNGHIRVCLTCYVQVWRYMYKSMGCDHKHYLWNEQCRAKTGNNLQVILHSNSV